MPFTPLLSLWVEGTPEPEGVRDSYTLSTFSSLGMEGVAGHPAALSSLSLRVEGGVLCSGQDLSS